MTEMSDTYLLSTHKNLLSILSSCIALNVCATRSVVLL